MSGRMWKKLVVGHGMNSIISSQNNSFCEHIDQETISCSCGEEEKEFAWVWSTREQGGQAGSVVLGPDQRQISFNPEYSSGTTAVRGCESLPIGHHHYWELKMTSAVYGTDIMVGVCTAKFDLKYAVHRFCSLLGRDHESWGYSYTGGIQHGGKFKPYGPRWGKGSIVGLHLDSWRGTLEFYLNRKPLGVAFVGLQNKEVYPIVTSTSAHSGMKLVSSYTFPVSLQCLASEVVCKQLCEKMKVRVEDLLLPPGLRTFIKNNYRPFMRSFGAGYERTNFKAGSGCACNSKRTHEDDPVETKRSKRLRWNLYTPPAMLRPRFSSSSSDSSSDGSSSPNSQLYFPDLGSSQSGRQLIVAQPNTTTSSISSISSTPTIPSAASSSSPPISSEPTSSSSSASPSPPSSLLQ
ncbi:SPRY domain-containing SOCS box protein 3-like [Penaeus indicus]|uniref:SPRY domain-containing SOCS box protein 3-like n=1 Tax=Penaeus indicus TaxID=29960 RepID=UPI00300C6A85